ncbi:MAG: cysteine hydrolase family protein [Mycobacteriales bacterium]
MKLSQTALVVIDVQNGFVRSGSRHVVPAITNLVSRWGAAGGAIVFTRYFNYENSPFERIMGWKQMRGAPETELISELKPYVTGQTVLDKTIYSALTEETAGLVAERGWTDLMICGIATESCVCKTAVDAFERGLIPWVVTDACASPAGREAHDAGLLVTRRFIGSDQLLKSDETLKRIRPIASHT